MIGSDKRFMKSQSIFENLNFVCELSKVFTRDCKLTSMFSLLNIMENGNAKIRQN